KLVRAELGDDQPKEVQERLLREGKSIAQLAHPNIVSVFDMGATGGEVFIAMELVEGGSLKRWLRETKPAWPVAREKFLAAGAGLSAAHRAGLVHRDFKPENVLIGDDGRVRVTDFGLASTNLAPLSMAAQPVVTGPRFRLTQSGAVMGTP